MQINISKTPSTNLKNLFWNIFFKSKNRGISLERHFPWLENSSGDVVFFEATISSIVIGGLVLRQKKYVVDGKEIMIGMIGLVCVASENRGVGIAAELLKRTIAYADNQGYDYLTLWTNQHHIYTSQKFYVADPWLYGWIQTGNCVKKLDNKNKTISESKLTPLPPFATAVFEYSLDGLSFTLLKDRDGDIVVEYKGNAADLGLFMIQTLPERWRLNVVKNDPLISALMIYGADVKLSAVNLQMWLDLREPHRQASIIEKITISVLDRI
jgi:GNAT superfamily N-acetyltransferase